MPDALHVVTIEDAAQLMGATPRWRELWKRCAATPFQSPDWLVPAIAGMCGRCLPQRLALMADFREKLRACAEGSQPRNTALFHSHSAADWAALAAWFGFIVRRNCTADLSFCDGRAIMLQKA